VLLDLGSRTFDLGTRAVVVGVLDGASPTSLGWPLDGSADVVEVTGDDPLGVAAAVGAVARRCEAPIAVGSADPAAAAAGLAAGAVMARHPGPAVPRRYAEIAAAREAVLVVSAPAPSTRKKDGSGASTAASTVACLVEEARAAVAAGVGTNRIVLDAGLAGAAAAEQAALLEASGRLASLGFAVMVSAGGGTSGPDEAVLHSLGVASGCRLLRARDVTVARRVADTLAAVLEAV
jgi:dihydropteroate synthase